MITFTQHYKTDNYRRVSWAYMEESFKKMKSEQTFLCLGTYGHSSLHKHMAMGFQVSKSLILNACEYQEISLMTLYVSCTLRPWGKWQNSAKVNNYQVWQTVTGSVTYLVLFRYYKFSSTSKWEGPFLKTLLGRGLDPWFFFNDILTVISSRFQKNVYFATYRSQKCKFSWSCFDHVANNWGTRSWEETVIQSVRQPVNEVILQSIFRECVLGL